MQTPYLTVDLETTHPEPEKAKIIEWAIVGECIDDSMRRLVNPGVPIPPETSAIHHIIDADVKDVPTWDKQQSHVKELLEQGDILVAHNKDLEEALLGGLVPGKPWLCTYRCALRQWPDAPAHNNEALRYWLEIGDDRGRRYMQRPHSAHHDAVVTSGILRKLLAAQSLQTLLNWSRELPVLPRCPIGAYRGLKWKDVPTDYLEWILFKAYDMRADIKSAARIEYETRPDTEMYDEDDGEARL